MKPRSAVSISILVLIAIVASCTQQEKASTSWLTVQRLNSPAGANTAEPNFYVGKGKRLYMNWVESVGDTLHRLRFSIHDGNAWLPNRNIAEGNNWFINWADFPSIVEIDERRLAAHWLQRNGEGTFQYDVRMRQSFDGGFNWGVEILPHTDGTQTEHGFASLVPWSNDRVLAVWLDGRKTEGAEEGDDGHGHHGEMTLRAAIVDSEGNLSNEALLDDRVCECCGTSIVKTPTAAIASYRDRSENEVRDIALVQFDGTRWSKPMIPHPDNWEIAGCPVNGASLASHGKRVAMVWFTGAGDASRVKLAVSDDEGETFGPAVRVDDGEPLGRVDAAMLPDGSVLASWMEIIDDGAEIRVCRVRPDGTKDPSIAVAKTSGARASGFPQMAVSAGRVYFAWTMTGEPTKIRLAVGELGE